MLKKVFMMFGLMLFALGWSVSPVAVSAQVAAVTPQSEASDFGDGNGSLRCASSAQQFIDWSAAAVTQGNSTLYVGFAQVSGNNQNPIIARWTDGTQDWCHDDIETTGDDGRGIGLWWDGGATAYGVFTATGTQGDPSQDYRRFTENGWLRHYTDASPGGGGGAKVSIVLRINAATGIPDAGTFITARLSNNKTNSTTATDLDVAYNGKVVVRLESAFSPRNTDKSRMECTNYPLDHFIEFSADLSAATGSLATNCTGNSSPPANAPVPQDIKRISPSDEAVDQPAAIAFSWEEDSYSSWYHVYLLGTGGWSFSQWYQGSQICTAGDCTTPTVNSIPAGEVSWWMASWGEDTTGANIDNHPGFMGAYEETTFRVGANPPGEINRVSPAGSVAASVVPFVWDHDSAAEWYQLYVVNPNGPDFNAWYAATDSDGAPFGATGVCSGMTCTLDPNQSGWWLSNGTYDWYIQAWGNGDFGPWNSTAAAFEVNVAAPGALSISVPTSPSNTNITISWDEQTQSAWYNLYVGNGSLTPHYQWHEGRAVCVSGTCSVDMVVSPGTYAVWMQAWGPGGISAWAGPASFTAN